MHHKGSLIAHQQWRTLYKMTPIYSGVLIRIDLGNSLDHHNLILIQVYNPFHTEFFTRIAKLVFHNWIMPGSGTWTSHLYSIYCQVPEKALPKAEEVPSNSIALNGSMLNRVQKLFHHIDVYPTISQVYEMIECAKRSTPEQFNLHDCELTFGQFCVFSAILLASYQSNTPQRKRWPGNTNLHRRVERANEFQRSNSDNHTKFDIFLGGSCNPTRWRSEIVIPELKNLEITYYNPQVEHWGPELIQLENYAKQNAEVLFFVIDNQTRGIASMIEVAFIASTNRNLILVIKDLNWPHCKIADDNISEVEFESLRRGRQYLRDVVERQSIPIFGDIECAIKSAVRVIRENVRPQDLTSQDHVIPVRMGHVSLGDKIIKMKRVFQSVGNKSNQITFKELPMVYRTLTSQDLSKEQVHEMARRHLERNIDSIQTYDSNGNNVKCRKGGKDFPSLDKICIDFEQFCCIFSELQQNRLKPSLERQPSRMSTLGRQLIQLPHNMLIKFLNFLGAIKSLLYNSFVSNQSSNHHRHHVAASNQYSRRHYLSSQQSNGTVFHSSQSEPQLLLPQQHQPKQFRPLSTTTRQPQPSNRRHSNLLLHTSSTTASLTSLVYDCSHSLYIGGDVEHQYLNETIIPLLKKHSITYSTMKFDKLAKEHMIPLEAKNIENSTSMLLFLVTENSLDISCMITAAHYIGLGYQMVLCIQSITDESPVAAKLSRNAIKDYNRGRTYLSDLATKASVPVYDQIDAAIERCIEICEAAD